MHITVKKGSGAMARGSLSVWRKVGACLLIASGLAGCLWTLIGLTQAGISAMIPVMLTRTSAAEVARPLSTQRPAVGPAPSAVAAIGPHPDTQSALMTPALKSTGPPPTSAAPGVGDQAPDFTLPRAQGGDLVLSEPRGERRVVLVFYHTVC
jgi:hypothetical protein